MYGMPSGRIEYEPKRFAAELAPAAAGITETMAAVYRTPNRQPRQEDVLLRTGRFQAIWDRYQQALADSATAVQPLPEKPDAVSFAVQGAN